jgi:cell division protein FtsB
LKATETDRTVKSLKAEVAKYQDLIAKGKALGDGQITVLLEKEKSIEDLEDKNAELEEQVKALKHTIKSKDALLDMQRQESK